MAIAVVGFAGTSLIGGNECRKNQERCRRLRRLLEEFDRVEFAPCIAGEAPRRVVCNRVIVFRFRRKTELPRFCSWIRRQKCYPDEPVNTRALIRPDAACC